MPIQEEYRVNLDAFHGPLDLLLFLIRRAEVDIHDIPVAAITDQYLEFLHEVEEIDVELAGEFLVMAATLIELKSRTLVPPEPEGGEDDADRDAAMSSSDPRFDLVRQLLAYQRFRVASEDLDTRRLDFSQRYALRPARPEVTEDEPDEPELLELDDAHIMDLADAYERITASIDFARLGDHVIEMDDTPIALYQEDLIDRLQRAAYGRLSLHSQFEGVTPSQRVGLFLAMLELARLRRITIRQEDLDRDIEVAMRSDESDEATERRSDEGVALADEQG